MKKTERIAALESEVAMLKAQVALLLSRTIAPLPAYPPIYPGQWPTTNPPYIPPMPVTWCKDVVAQ